MDNELLKADVLKELAELLQRFSIVDPLKEVCFPQIFEIYSFYASNTSVFF